MAFAATGTQAAGPVGSAGNFSCSGSSATGHLYSSGVSCPATITKNNIFTFLICNMEQLSSNLMGQMFCGMIHDLTPAVMSVLVLSVLFFGISFTIGIVPMQAKEFMVYLLKFACVFIFATKADYLVNFGYKILITGVRDGVATAVSALYPNPLASANAAAVVAAGNGAEMYGYLDKFLGKAMSFATDYVGVPKDGTRDGELCKNAVFAGLAIMAIVFPPIFYIAIMILFKVALTFLRAIFGYVYALVGIAFLLTLAPFFLSFYLFKSTRPFFEKWIGYLISMTLQMVIVFAFLAFILTIDVKHISDSLPNIIMYSDQNKPETTSFRFPWDYCTLCRFKVVDRNPDGTASNTPFSGNSAELISKGMMVCVLDKDGKKVPIGPGDELSPVKKLGPDNKTPLLKDPTKPADEKNYVYEMPSSTNMNNLFSFATKGLLSLFVLAFLVDALLSYTASLAQMLASAGAMYTPQLGGGYARYPVMDVPGSTLIENAGEKFREGYQMGSNTIEATSQGLKDSFEGMVMGTRTRTDAQGNVTTTPADGGGIAGSFAAWLSNPNRDYSGH